MINLLEIGHWQRASAGRVMQILIMAREMEDILSETFSASEDAYSLIGYNWDQNQTFNYFETSIDTLSKFVDQGMNHYFLRNHTLTPVLNLPKNPIIGGASKSEINKWLIYLGLIDIKCNIGNHTTALIPSSETIIMHIEKCCDSRIPSEIRSNADYTKVYSKLGRNIAQCLSHRRILTMTNGKIVRSKRCDVSDRVFQKVNSGDLFLPKNTTLE